MRSIPPVSHNCNCEYIQKHCNYAYAFHLEEQTNRKTKSNPWPKMWCSPQRWDVVIHMALSVMMLRACMRSYVYAMKRWQSSFKKQSILAKAWPDELTNLYIALIYTVHFTKMVKTQRRTAIVGWQKRIICESTEYGTFSSTKFATQNNFLLGSSCWRHYIDMCT